VDPVCSINVDHDTAAGRMHLLRRHYWFCPMNCAPALADNPDAYAHNA